MPKILISGASGKLGSLVIKHLLASSGMAPGDIIAASRDPSKLTDLAAKGIETRKVDFTDASTLDSAFQGVDRLLVISTDAIGARIEQHKAAIEAAKKAGVSRIFYTSMFNPKTSKVIFAPEHAASEEAIETSGLAYTIFRNGWYMENLFTSLDGALASGRWYSSSADGRITYIAREDLARAMAAAIANPVADNIIYSLGGETGYTKAEIAALVTEISGRPLEVINITDEQLESGLPGGGRPAHFGPLTVFLE
ncbi:NAD(P)H-binding protein, partial [Rhizobium sp.]|uniref:NAD(P)H-binding protein n=1 Tax=Rhizobium sp. TaxID=391 RepID=UPI000E93A470|nr:NAD(P)-dependent oxidoreductase [Rhizobium sp.]